MSNLVSNKVLFLHHVANDSTDIGNEDLRAQVKTLQYELESFKQERELNNLRHDKELRDVQLKAEEIFRKAQVQNIYTWRFT